MLMAIFFLAETSLNSDIVTEHLKKFQPVACYANPLHPLDCFYELVINRLATIFTCPQFQQFEEYCWKILKVAFECHGTVNLECRLVLPSDLHIKIIDLQFSQNVMSLKNASYHLSSHSCDNYDCGGLSLLKTIEKYSAPIRFSKECYLFWIHSVLMACRQHGNDYIGTWATSINDAHFFNSPFFCFISDKELIRYLQETKCVLFLKINKYKILELSSHPPLDYRCRLQQVFDFMDKMNISPQIFQDVKVNIDDIKLNNLELMIDDIIVPQKLNSLIDYEATIQKWITSFHFNKRLHINLLISKGLIKFTVNFPSLSDHCPTKNVCSH
jgi:hypothetical protein